MRSSLRKPLYVLLSLIMAATLLVGCTTTAPSATTAPSTAATTAPTTAPTTEATTAPEPSVAKLDPVTIKIILFADKKVDTDYIWGKIGDYTKDKLNATFTTTWVPAADYNTKLPAMAASGDDWDFNFDGDWVVYPAMVNNGAYLDVSKLLPQYAPDLYATYQKNGVLPVITQNGKIFCLPWTMAMSQRPFSQWREDLIEKAGGKIENGSIKTLEDVDALYAKLKAAAPDKKIAEAMDIRGVQPKYELATMAYQFAYSLNDPACKITHLAFTDAYMEVAQWDKKWQDAGYIWKDYLTDQHDGNALIAAGEQISNVTWHEWANCTMDWSAGAVRGTSELYPDKKFGNRSPLSNILCINTNSKNPERDLMFINMLQVDQKLFDLVMYGEEGRNYTLSADGAATYPSGMTATNSSYMDWQGRWAFWNPQYLRPDATYGKDFWVNEAKFASQPENVNAPLVAFFPNPASVQTELTLMGATDTKFQKMIQAGLAGDYQKAVADYRAELTKDGVDKVTVEFQKQIDTYLASKK
jgi:putative aldouronate transport system substrate-binding protein